MKDPTEILLSQDLPDLPSPYHYRQLGLRACWYIARDPEFPLFFRVWALSVYKSRRGNLEADFNRGQMQRLLTVVDSDTGEIHEPTIHGLRAAMRKLKKKGLIHPDSTTTWVQFPKSQFVRPRRLSLEEEE